METFEDQHQTLYQCCCPRMQQDFSFNLLLMKPYNTKINISPFFYSFLNILVKGTQRMSGAIL